MSFNLLPCLSVRDYVVSHLGRPVFDFRSSLNTKTGNRDTIWTKSKHNYINFDKYRLDLAYTEKDSCGTTDSDFYSYYLVPRIKASGVLPIQVPTVAKYLSTRFTPSMTTLLHRLVGLLSHEYNIVTDIPDLPGIYVGDIYREHPELWNMGYTDLVQFNLYKYLIESKIVNLDKVGQNTIVLMLHNAELAYDISSLMKAKSIPITILGR